MAACRHKSIKLKVRSGRTSHTTPGSVVYRSPVLELIPISTYDNDVYTAAVLSSPRKSTSFYVFDLAPEKVLVQFSLKGDFQNLRPQLEDPTAQERHFRSRS